MAWLKTPDAELEDRQPLTPKQLELFKRWCVADDLFRENLSERATVAALVKRFGYSEDTARRDLQGAIRSWGTRPRNEKGYLSNMLVDFLSETMVRAAKDKKFGDVARIAKVIIEAAGLNRKDEAPVDPEDLLRPTTVIMMHNPVLVGGMEMDDEARMALVRKVIAEKREKGILDLSEVARLIPDESGAEPEGTQD